MKIVAPHPAAFAQCDKWAGFHHMFPLQGFAPCTAHDAATLHRSCSLQPVLLVRFLDKLVPEVTWMCSRALALTRIQASGFDTEHVPTGRFPFLNIRFYKPPKNHVFFFARRTAPYPEKFRFPYARNHTPASVSRWVAASQGFWS